MGSWVLFSSLTDSLDGGVEEGGKKGACLLIGPGAALPLLQTVLLAAIKLHPWMTFLSYE